MKNKIWISEEELELYKTTAKEQSLEFSPKIELEQKKNFYQYKIGDFKITVPKIEPLTKELELAI